ncbi:MAG: ATP-dependent RecD-like DNA helicase [Christensenellaceae bacterium]|nr:ATP-dependent RecD-like DNA helicase [Christensenellaceae bacterium]
MTYVEGIVIDVIHRSEDGRYTVLEIDCEGTLVTCVGSIPFIQPGESVRFYGAYTTHRVFGRQFKVAGMEMRMPEGDESIRLFLSGGLIKGVGEVLAARIVEEFHEQTFDVIEHDPLALSRIKGISPALAERIHEQVMEHGTSRTVIVALQNIGLSLKQSFAAYETYGPAAPDIIKRNPYQLIDDIYGIGFEKADRIAAQLGLENYQDLRIFNGVKHILTKSMETEGHTCLPRTMLIKRSCELLQTDAETIEDILKDLLFRGAIAESTYRGTPAVAAYTAFHAESYCAYRLVNLKNAVPSVEISDKVVDKLLMQDTMLTEMQERAILGALENSLCIITGGPGTGKTTILNQLITILERSGLKTALAAPTGRAAKRMEKATMRKAQTIHRLLEYGCNPEVDDRAYCRFGRDEDNPIEADAVIIDETSMVDIYLMQSLLKAISPGTRLIFTGDADQLPSVGPGNVLNDMIVSGLIPVFRLTEVFRQRGNIALNAHRVNQGENIELFSAGDFVFIPADNTEDTLEIVKREYRKRIVEEGIPMDEVQIICPIKRGQIGVYELNKELRELMNPRLADKDELTFGDTTYREGDKIMQTSNNYSKEWYLKGTLKVLSHGMGAFNGDMGTIERIHPGDGTLEILFDGERLAEYDRGELDQLEHAYAVTVHKSQGSEFDTVILPLYYGATPFLTRNLFYTAITRAKKKLIIVGAQRTIKHMITNSRIAHRFTALKYELANYAASFEKMGSGLPIFTNNSFENEDFLE